MTRDQITVGVTLTIIATRWDRPLGTIARVTETGASFVEGTWWFTVEWLTYVTNDSIRRLRLWEEDLPTFKLVTGSIVIPLHMTRTQQRELSRPVPLQAFLHFTKADDDE